MKSFIGRFPFPEKIEVPTSISDWFNKQVKSFDNLYLSSIKKTKNHLVVQLPGYSKDNVEVIFDESTRQLSINAEQIHEITGEEMKFDYNESFSGKKVKDVKLVNGELIIEFEKLENAAQTKLEIN